MNIDFHSYILPGMEKGTKDVETSIKILEKEGFKPLNSSRSIELDATPPEKTTGKPG